MTSGSRLSSLAAHRTELAYAFVALVVAGVLLGAVAWTRSPPAGPSFGMGPRTMTFDYTAEVPRSPAYQDTTVTPEEPVFRRLTDTVTVTVTYVGDPGSVKIDAELSMSSGWRWQLPLTPAQEAPDGKFEGTATLELKAIERLATNGSRAAGVEMSDVRIEIAAEVTTADGQWRPTLPFLLSSNKLALADEKPVLTVTAGGFSETPEDESLSLLGISIGIWPARILSAALLLAGICLGLLLMAVPQPTPQEQADQARRKYEDLIVHVTDVPMPRGPVIDIPDLDALAKLAQRYALLIFHWANEAGDLYFVQDETAMYRCLVPRVAATEVPTT